MPDKYTINRRSLYCPIEIWKEIKKWAERDGKSTSEFIIEAAREKANGEFPSRATGEETATTCEEVTESEYERE